MKREEKKRLRHKKRREEKREKLATVHALHNKKPEKAPLPQGLAMVQACMTVYGKRGNPKDYVVLSEHTNIYDGEKLYKLQATLPEKLEKGQPVYIVDTSREEQPMKQVDVLEDNGHNLLLRGEHAEFVVDRGSVYPTSVPGRATPVHKSMLGKYVGEKIAANWWRAGRRAVPQPRVNV